MSYNTPAVRGNPAVVGVADNILVIHEELRYMHNNELKQSTQLMLIFYLENLPITISCAGDHLATAIHKWILTKHIIIIIIIV